MAGIFTAFKLLSVLLILVNLFKGNEAISGEIPVPSNARINSLSGRKCLNFLWHGPCTPQICKTTLKVKLEKEAGGSPITFSINSFKPFITNGNQTYVQCFYDIGAGENSSCCGDITTGLSHGFDIGFGDKDRISFHTKTCLNESENCVSKTTDWPFSFVLPWKNPCLFNNPCRNPGTCTPAVNDYNCTCWSDWKGKDCTVPTYVTEKKGKCLEDSSKGTVLYLNTIKECGDECKKITSKSCQSFEFKKLSPGSNQGNCTLHKSNTLDHKLVSCGADYYEVTAYLEPNSGAGITSVVTVVNLLLILVATFALLAQ